MALHTDSTTICATRITDTHECIIVHCSHTNENTNETHLCVQFSNHYHKISSPRQKI